MVPSACENIGHSTGIMIVMGTIKRHAQAMRASGTRAERRMA
jgi:hypothetical protein